MAQTIIDRASFSRATGGSNQVAGLYFYSLLDCINVVAEAVTMDFFARPHLYTKLAGDPKSEIAAARLIAKLGSRLGADEAFPSKEQRREIYMALMGAPQMNGNANFARLRDDVIAAVTAYSESLFEKGVAMLRERVRATIRPFREYLLGVQGSSTRWSKEGALDPLTRNFVYPILRNAGVAAVFGIADPPKSSWPFEQDANADKLMEEISKQLGYMDSSGQPLTRERFSNLQRAAIFGTEAIVGAIAFADPSDEAALDALITLLYVWGAALRDVQRGWIEATPPMIELGSSVPRPVV